MAIDRTPNIAVFADYENVALGARDAGFDRFDASLVLQRLLDKGKIIVKRAYCDWKRYDSAKKPLHEAGFELIEVPHTRMSGKNSADIRLVVDALDMCHTKTHIDIFALITGDSDFSPLAGKLRENDKLVIAVGVKNSTSGLLVESCDEFIYYDDLVQRTTKRRTRTRGQRKPAAAAAQAAAAAAAPAESAGAQAPGVDTTEEALDLVLATVEALSEDREGDIWGSMVKQALKRKRPHFTESAFGFRSFNALLEEAHKRGVLEIAKDDRSGGYRITGFDAG